MSRGISLYLHVHQPWRIRNYTVFDTANRHDYFANGDGSRQDNQAIFQKVANKSYRPMNELLLDLLERNPEFKLSLSITGSWVEQAELWAPDVIDQFRRMTDTGRVEIVGETYYHSLAFFYSRQEFEQQVKLHSDRIEQLFGVRPRSFRNTELAYNDELALWADQAGYDTILAEGWDPILGWRSPNYVYRPAGAQRIKLMLKNYRLSDDIAFRFSNREWSNWPLDSSKYQSWLDSSFHDGAKLVNLFMDYETFGEHQWSDSGIFDFFGAFIDQWSANPDNTFYTVSQAANILPVNGDISMPDTVTWADSERDLSAMLGNSMQQEALRYLYALEEDIWRSGDTELVSDWRRLQASDHVYYMSTKQFTDGEVHAYFSPYDSPYDAFLYFMNALRDLRYRLIQRQLGGW